jgi:tetratricopeptide (TPR) repeat protein
MRLHGQSVKEVTEDAAIQLKRAIRMLDAITTYEPKNWSAFWVKGKAYQAMGDRKAACVAFKASFDIHDEDTDVAREYMYECLNLGDGAEGLRAARRALELKPSDAGLHANLALALIIAAKPKEALAAIDESLRIDPEDKISQNVRKVVLQILDGTRPQPKTLTEIGK